MSLSRRRLLGAALLASTTMLPLGAVTQAAVPAQRAHVKGKRLRIGTTLHPYYSFVANIVKDRADVIPLIDSNANPHGYTPRPDDMKRCTTLDALVVNGIGHDEWAFAIVKAAGREKNLPIIYSNASVALIPIGGDAANAKVVNPHTFVSTTAAVQQVYEIARQLAALDPGNGDFYRSNASDYALRIRKLRAEFMAKIATRDVSTFRCATMHAGYGYMMQEFGLKTSAIIEPRHGVSPTPRQLAVTIDEIKAAKVQVLFAEKYFAQAKLAETIQKETGAKIYALSHISEGPYTPEKFEVEMKENLDTLYEAIVSVTKPRAA